MADTATWIALGIALYGGGLSSYNVLVQRHRQHEELVRDIRVTGRYRPGSDPEKPILHVRAYNAARRAVEVTRVGLVMRGGTVVWQGPTTPGLPARLDDGESVEVPLMPEWIELTQLAMSDAEPVGVAVGDASGAVYKSPPGPDSSPPAGSA